MSERPTPETDARTYIPVLGASTVPAKFARKLERERDEAREEFLIANDKMVEAECRVREIASVLERVKRERDEAREKIKQMEETK